MSASEINSFRRVDFNQETVYTWIKDINFTPDKRRKIQALNIPRRFALETLGDATSIVLQSAHSNELIKCKIITATRNEKRVEKYLTIGWIKFVKENKLKAGDQLILKLPQSPRAIEVEIVRGNNNA
ncbi:hypothetical protein TSUD_185930 [Trifolium subterraneum]|uniref:TF-B3 domain-containing protein n=1 Tax=Trifolium subterraneum TaxID=3900 RepID=A0A2Z6NDZ6_TRISU|nr:hypothetical protein TSUD_185930 [Trifolium subterraneum]